MSSTTTITKTSTNQTNAASSTPSPRWTHLFAVLAAIALGATLLRPQWTTTAATTAKPDVVVFVADDLGANDVGYAHAGGPRAFATPTIDKLARKSLRLTRFYGAPMCTPARAALTVSYTHLTLPTKA